jgi:UDP-N-acetylmuramoyl-tripeptide--D-alanyl-D-alanine ligase
MFKRSAKRIVSYILGRQVRRLVQKNSNLKVIIVAGSIGKTSTKFAIAAILKEKFNVRFQEGNYNDIVSVPLVFFNESLPSIFNPIAWIRLFLRNEKTIRNVYNTQVVVLELGTDGPGQMQAFKRYLHADIGVLTAITPEHMEYFKTIEAVAEEEMVVQDLVDWLVVNGDLCAIKYISRLRIPHKVYQINKDQPISEYSVCAAKVVANKLGLSDQEISDGVKRIGFVSGRLNRLQGINESLIIDDTYNSSPEACKAALEILYNEKTATQRIAILGSMNELGDHSKEAHESVAVHCTPDKLDCLVTIGHDANEFLAPIAQRNGCVVKSCENPYDAGQFVADVVKKGAVILAKGSQNGVFAEESVKYLLAHTTDQKFLVRQSDAWMKKKKHQFAIQ